MIQMYYNTNVLIVQMYYNTDVLLMLVQMYCHHHQRA